MSRQNKKDFTMSSLEENLEIENSTDNGIKEIIEKYKKLDVESELVLNKVTERRKRKQNAREKIPA